ALVEDIVLPDVVLGPAAAAVLQVVAAMHGVRADPVAALATENTLHEGQMQLGLEAAGRGLPLNPEAHPATTRETRVGFERVGVFAHDGVSCRGERRGVSPPVRITGGLTPRRSLDY